MFIWLQFTLFFIAATLVISLPASKKWALLLTLAFSLFAILQLSSYFLGGTLIDYKYLEHANFSDLWSIKEQYIMEFVIGIVAFIILSIILYTIGRAIRTKSFSLKWTLPILLLSIIGLSIHNGMFANLYDVASLKSVKEKSFQAALSDLGIPANDYVISSEVTASPGKNIIVISLESLERGFLEPPFEHLTPNLRSLKKDHTYYPMFQNSGSEWTTGSMYTLITGLPSFFRTNGNDTFQNSHTYKSATLTDVLKAANYDLTYLIAKKEFAGINDMLTTFGFKVKSEKDFETIYPTTNWGLHDMDLFAEARKEITEKAATGQPFALFLSTISGHFPNGVYDDRLEDVLPPQPTHLEFMTAGVDYYIGELISFLKAEKLLDNTVLYIYPDHKLMGKTSPVIREFQNKRDLYLLSNAQETSYKPGEPIYQIDLPKLIIEGAQIETNASFLTEYIKDENKVAFIEDNKSNLLALNEASIKNGHYRDGVSLQLTDSLLTITNPNSKYTNTTILNSDDYLYRMRFDHKMRLVNVIEISEENALKTPKNTDIIVSRKRGMLQSSLRIGDLIRVPKVAASTIQYSKEELESYKDWMGIHAKYQPLANKIYLKSTGYNATLTRGVSEIYVGLQSYTLQRGLNALTRTNGSYQVENFDTYTEASEADAFVKKLEYLLQEELWFAIVAHDSAEKELEPHRETLQKLGLPELANLGLREAYIAYPEDYFMLEERDAKSISVQLPLRPLPSPKRNELAKDTNRFIAHAGGQIDGINYTNSLEALNLSYANGFRLFELDIIKTSDGAYVAAHDWEVWKRYTGYTGATPVSERTFLQYKIREKYTPLNLRRINAWFKDHPDAILVTDKVNDPIDFSEKFVDKSRLKMELFSIQAMEDSQGLGITAMPSQRIINYLGDDVLNQLKEWNVTEIAISRKRISDLSELLLQLKDAGIRTYAYHVNFEKSKDEQYVFDYELDYIFGMYADKWHFGK